MCPFGMAYHYNPLDARVIGKMVRETKATVLPATATFFRNCLRRCPKEDFADMTTAVAGAEKLPNDVGEAWKEKCYQILVEGFGATEISPVLSANLPPCRFQDTFHKYYRLGSIGKPLAGIAVRITDPETGEELPLGTPGMLEVKGPTVMLGYYKAPEKTAAAIRNGWYITGDIARIDEDGFLFITGRLSRISKIGGEMVPLVHIEEEIEKILRLLDPQDNDKDFTPRVAVTAVSDSRKGERLVVFLADTVLPPGEICAKLIETNLPPIWIPSPNDFHPIDVIRSWVPKPNLKEIHDKAIELYSDQT